MMKCCVLRLSVNLLRSDFTIRNHCASWAGASAGPTWGHDMPTHKTTWQSSIYGFLPAHMPKVSCQTASSHIAQVLWAICQ